MDGSIYDQLLDICREGSLEAHAIGDAQIAVLRHSDDGVALVQGAISSGNLSAVGLLLQYVVCDLDKLLVLACQHSRIDIIAELINVGANIHHHTGPQFLVDVLSYPSPPYVTPAVVDTVVAAGCVILHDDPQLLHLAAEHGLAQLVEQMLALGTHDSDAIRTANYSACCGGHPEVFRRLHEVATERNALSFGQMLFSVAVANGHDECAMAVAAAYSDVVTEAPWHCLRAAVEQDCVAAATAIVAARGISVDERRGCGSLLSYAADPAIVRCLLKANAEADPPRSRSVLSAACERLQPEAVLLLLDAGADTDAEGPGGLSPLCTAVHAACTEEHLPDKARVLELLLDEGASTAGSLHACAGASADAHGPVCARLLLARDPALLNRCVAGLEDGVTPMMVAARAKSVPMVQLLLEAGAGARARDADGVSVLSYAFYAPQGDDGRRVPQRTREVLGMLLRAGADPLVTDRVGWTVLMRCVSVRVTGFGDDAVNVLLGVLLEAASRASVPHNGILRDKTWKRYQ